MKDKKINFKKIINVFLNFFGKKNKKSFALLINHITESYEKEALITLEEKKMFRNMVNFGDKKINTIMTPRADIIAINYDANLDTVKKIINENGHTRIPIYRDNIDHMIGFIHSKDLVRYLLISDNEFNIDKIMRKILFVPCSMKLLETLLRMRSSRVHIAVVLDEFGGVNGLVTIENIVEEIVGEINDEHDLPLESSFFQIKKIDHDTYHFGGRVALEKLEEIFDVKLEDCSAETVGGLAIYIFKTIPKIGDKIEKYQLIFKIIDSDKRIVKTVEVKRLN